MKGTGDLKEIEIIVKGKNIIGDHLGLCFPGSDSA
jgi:hypothetical protein